MNYQMYKPPPVANNYKHDKWSNIQELCCRQLFKTLSEAVYNDQD